MTDHLIRKHLKQFQPYHSARSEAHTARIFLDANELSLGSPIGFDGVDLNRYPDPMQHALRAKLARRIGLSADMIFVGVGSDEIIDLLIRLTCEPSTDSVAILDPTYGVYRVAAEVNAVRTISISLDDSFQIEINRTLESALAGTKIIFCCSPNNPTGNLLRRADILTLCQKFSGLIVVDEAYIEFARKPSLAVEVTGHDNLIVLRTLSKAWGLAGARCGYCVADPGIIAYLLRIKSPYNMNAVTAKIACGALENEEFFQRSVRLIATERERMSQELGECPSVRRVYPSQANFLLVEFQDANSAFEALYRNGIVVRRRSEPRLQNCLRITIGTPEENALVLDTLKRRS